MDTRQHARDGLAIGLPAEKRDDQNKRQRYQPSNRKENDPPENPDEALNDQFQNALCECLQHDPPQSTRAARLCFNDGQSFVFPEGRQVLVRKFFIPNGLITTIQRPACLLQE